VPVGGATGQVLAKTSGTDYATEWTKPGSVRVWLDRSSAAPYGLPGWTPLAAAVTTANIANLDIFNLFVVDRHVTVDQLACEVTTTASADLRMGLTALDEKGYPTGAPLEDSGDISTSSLGVKTFTFASPRLLAPGVYATIINTSSNTVAVRVYPGKFRALWVPATFGTSIIQGGGSVSRTYGAFANPAASAVVWDLTAGNSNAGAFCLIRISNVAP
jgi:hypothetical protein